MSGISDSLVRHRPHAPRPAHPDDRVATPQTAPAAARSAAAAARTRPGGNVSAFGPGLDGTPPGGATGCVCGHGTALDPAVGSPRPEISAICAHGSAPGGGAGPAGVSRPAPLSAALATQGLHLQPRTVRKYLRLMGASYQRTKSCLRHTQDPERGRWPAPSYRRLKKSPRRPSPALVLGRKRILPLSAPHLYLEPTRHPPPRPLRKYAGPTRECGSRAGGPRHYPHGALDLSQGYCAQQCSEIANRMSVRI